MNRMSYEIFKSHIPDLLIKYPNLRLVKIKGEERIKGIVDVRVDADGNAKSFLIEIAWTVGYPYVFPILYEVGGEIPPLNDWHKFKNNSCCLTVAPDEKIKCSHGITLLEFFEGYVVSFLANHLYRLYFGKYKYGEYSHSGEKALNQFYLNLLGTQDKVEWMKIFAYCFFSDRTYVPSVLSINFDVFRKMNVIGYKTVANDFRKIINV